MELKWQRRKARSMNCDKPSEELEQTENGSGRV